MGSCSRRKTKGNGGGRRGGRCDVLKDDRDDLAIAAEWFPMPVQLPTSPWQPRALRFGPDPNLFNMCDNPAESGLLSSITPPPPADETPQTPHPPQLPLPPQQPPMRPFKLEGHFLWYIPMAIVLFCSCSSVLLWWRKRQDQKRFEIFVRDCTTETEWPARKSTSGGSGKSRTARGPKRTSSNALRVVGHAGCVRNKGAWRTSIHLAYSNAVLKVLSALTLLTDWFGLLRTSPPASGKLLVDKASWTSKSKTLINDHVQTVRVSLVDRATQVPIETPVVHSQSAGRGIARIKHRSRQRPIWIRVRTRTPPDGPKKGLGLGGGGRQSYTSSMLTSRWRNRPNTPVGRFMFSRDSPFVDVITGVTSTKDLPPGFERFTQTSTLPLDYLLGSFGTATDLVTKPTE